LIVDSSALLAIIFLEPDEPRMLNAIVEATSCRMSAANWLETAIVIDGRKSPVAAAQFTDVIARMAIEIVPVSPEHARVARLAHQRYGRGQHPARLNFGDCFAYALAKCTGEPLLFKGGDFSQTDIEPALTAPL
jgi:ribonuclease VapC